MLLDRIKDYLDVQLQTEPKWVAEDPVDIPFYTKRERVASWLRGREPRPYQTMTIPGRVRALETAARMRVSNARLEVGVKHPLIRASYRHLGGPTVCYDLHGVIVTSIEGDGRFYFVFDYFKLAHPRD